MGVGVGVKNIDDIFKYNILYLNFFSFKNIDYDFDRKIHNRHCTND